MPPVDLTHSFPTPTLVPDSHSFFPSREPWLRQWQPSLALSPCREKDLSYGTTGSTSRRSGRVQKAAVAAPTAIREPHRHARAEKAAMVAPTVTMAPHRHARVEKAAAAVPATTREPHRHARTEKAVVVVPTATMASHQHGKAEKVVAPPLVATRGPHRDGRFWQGKSQTQIYSCLPILTELLTI